MIPNKGNQVYYFRIKFSYLLSYGSIYTGFGCKSLERKSGKSDRTGKTPNGVIFVIGNRKGGPMTVTTFNIEYTFLGFILLLENNIKKSCI